MVYITGDIHGQVLRIESLVNTRKITSKDIIVLLGDVGVNYYGAEHGDARRKEALNALGVPILCIHGNHEMRPETIPSYRLIPWHGGKVYAEEAYPNLLFARDGEVYDLEGRKAIAIGGAYSVDKWIRLLRNMSWFEDEQPSDKIKARVIRALARRRWKIDLVLSHTCPHRFIPQEAKLPGINQSTVDNSTELWLDSIAQRLSYRAWYCGHWHINKRFNDMHFLYEYVEAVI